MPTHELSPSPRPTVSILIVEDDPGHRQLLQEELSELDYAVHTAESAETACAALAEQTYAVVICDLRLPGQDGFSVLEAARQRVPAPGFIMLTGFGTIDQAVAALKAGADDFLTKPVDLEHLKLTLTRVLQTLRLRDEVRLYRQVLDDQGFHGLYGRSPAMLRLFDLIRRIARSDASVLITGESGTGKDLVARALHAESPRHAQPFVALNCAGIPESLLESELFGHVAGAFSGAKAARNGLFVEADGGTLFLDEIGEMPAAMQAKLLRVLQDGRIRPVGSNQEIPTDVRVIAATHRDLSALMQHGEFREDLFFRLETFRIEVPPLRERGEDLHALLRLFLQRFALAQGQDLTPPSFDPEALRTVLAYPFPGNVRELASLVERAATLAREGVIQLEDLPERMFSGETLPSTPQAAQAQQTAALKTLAEIEAEHIRQVLAAVDGNKQQAAKILGIGRKTLYRKL